MVQSRTFEESHTLSVIHQFVETYDDLKSLLHSIFYDER